MGWGRWEWVVVAGLLTLGACECEGKLPSIGSDAGSDSDASSPSTCPEAQQCASGLRCCAASEECVDDRYCYDVCEHERCGDNRSVCCDAGEICLDGVVCAASCAAGETVCGASLDTCCPSGDVCLNDVCVTPGAACADDYDCLTEGDYCELTIGQCFAIPTVEPACEQRPAFGEIDLAVEWHFPGVMAGGNFFDHVLAAPVAGDVTGDGIPDVIVPVYRGDTGSNTILVALNGEDGSVHWTTSPGSDEPNWISPAALANFDASDDALEIVYHLRGGGIRILDGDGVTEIARRTTGGVSVGQSAPAIADFNHDGTPDIVVGCHAMDGTDIENPSLDFFDRGACNETAQNASVTSVADLDGDGELEVTSGAIAVQVGSGPSEILWERMGENHGHTAVADLNVDGVPEVIVVSGGTIEVLDGPSGAVRLGPGGTWQDDTFSIPGGGVGGPPTVADFDADGMPEVSAAGQGQYAVYDPDCLVVPPRSGGDCAPMTTNFLRWASATQDISSSVTGSSVFDFQGDGVSEVVYNDECFLRIYDGRDGSEVLSSVRPNSSRTAFEYPLVVDVDRDGNSEFVVPANNDQITRDDCLNHWATALGVAVMDLPMEYSAGTTGVFAFGDPDDRWVRTRPIWNQFSYHVTNVGDRGEVPTNETDNWSVDGLNNYRQNVQGDGVFNVANLTVELDSVGACAANTVRLTAVITNSGSRGVASGVEVEFVQLSPEPVQMVGGESTTMVLLPGESERITIEVSGVPSDIDLTFEVRVNGAGATSRAIECDYDDNTAQAVERCIEFG